LSLKTTRPTANGSFLEMDFSDAKRLAYAHGHSFNINGSVWVYKIKRDGYFKAHLCLNGASQREGIDYDQTFKSTLRHSSLRVLMAIQARLGLNSCRHDLVAAFLQGSLQQDELVFMRYPQGYQQLGADGKPRVFLVQKPVYGLRQAGRRFQCDFFAWLVLPIADGGAGMSQCHHEP